MRYLWTILLSTAFVLSACASGSASPTAAPPNTPTSSQQAQNSPTPIPSPSPVPTAAAAPTPSTGQPALQVLVQTGERMSETPHREKSHGEISGKIGGQDITYPMEISEEIQTPTRRHSVFGSVKGQPAFEYYLIDDTLYLKGTDGSWTKLASSTTPQAGQNSSTPKPPVLAQLTQRLQDVREVGQELLGGTPTRVIVGTLPIQEKDVQAVYNFKVWIGNDGFPRQAQMDGTVTQSSDGNPVTYTMKLTTTYERDPSIKIEPPIK